MAVELRQCRMAAFAALALWLSVIPCMSHAGVLDLSTLSCGEYENEVLPAAASSRSADSIDTVMWLFGYSVAKSGAHVLYSDALAPFGFALDNECKSNLTESLLDALSIVKPESKNPMNLANVECSTFATRHAEFSRTDAESAKTIMMWLFGFAVATSGSHLFDPDSLHAFENALLAECSKQPHETLLVALTALKTSKSIKQTPRPRSTFSAL